MKHFTSELNYEKQLLEEKLKREEELAQKEKAAKRVVQSILAEEYKKDMEKKRKDKETEAELAKRVDSTMVNQLIHETEPNTIKEKMVTTSHREPSHGDCQCCDW